MGILILWGLVLCHRSFYSWMKHSFKRHWPLFIVCLIALIYATGLVFTYNECLIAKVPIKEGSKLMNLLSIFRSSGRYIWLPSYILTLVPIIYFYKYYKSSAWKINILGVGFIIVQMWDVTPLYSRIVKDEYYFKHEHIESLVALSQEANAIYTYPTYRRDLVEKDDMQYLVGRLGKYQKNITAGHLPRPNIKAQDDVITHLLSSENTAIWPIGDKDIILTSDKEAAVFRAIYDNKSALCYGLGAYRVLIKSDNVGLEKWLLANHWTPASIETVTIDAYMQETDVTITTIVVAVDEASTGLTESQRNRLQFWGKELPTLAYRNSYIGIKTGPLPTTEYIRTDETDLFLDTMIHNVSLNIISTAGVDHSPLLKVNSQTIDSLSRGLNIIKIDEKGNIKSKACFDTYRSGYVTPDQIKNY